MSLCGVYVSSARVDMMKDDGSLDGVLVLLLLVG